MQQLENVLRSTEVPWSMRAEIPKGAVRRRMVGCQLVRRLRDKGLARVREHSEGGPVGHRRRQVAAVFAQLDVGGVDRDARPYGIRHADVDLERDL